MHAGHVSHVRRVLAVRVSAQEELGTGARYNPATDAWTPIPTSGAPSPRLVTSVWAGDGLFIFGGYNGEHLNDTYCFWVKQ